MTARPVPQAAEPSELAINAAHQAIWDRHDSGQTLLSHNAARAVAAAVVAAVQGPLQAEALRAAAADADPWDHLHAAASWLMDHADAIEAGDP